MRTARNSHYRRHSPQPVLPHQSPQGEGPGTQEPLRSCLRTILASAHCHMPLPCPPLGRGSPYQNQMRPTPGYFPKTEPPRPFLSHPKDACWHWRGNHSSPDYPRGRAQPAPLLGHKGDCPSSREASGVLGGPAGPGQQRWSWLPTQDMPLACLPRGKVPELPSCPSSWGLSQGT